MEYIVRSGSPEKSRSGCLVVAVYENRRLSPAARALDDASGGAIGNILRRGDLNGRNGQCLLLHHVPNMSCERVLLVGGGRDKAQTDGGYRKAVLQAMQAVLRTGARDAVLYLADMEIKGRDIGWKVRHAVEATEEARYRFTSMKGSGARKDNGGALERVVISVPKRGDLAAGEEAARIGQAIAAGVALTKDLGNLPGNVCTPTYLADTARDLGRQYGIETTILEKSDMESLGMGSLLSVARGSRQPPKLIVMEYRGGGTEAPIALVGKGLTFDAGGISIKPAANMDEMKYDMCGGASVLGALKAAAELKLALNIVGVVPSSENLPDGDANKPGDIVTSMSGQTIEILNTDAEGRLILCDALTYTERFKPSTVVDIATLTGACVVALGKHASGLFSNHDGLARELLAAGEEAADRAWHMPLWEEYQDGLDSNFADMANVGPREGGAITAACFLSRYTKMFRWAHLDVAGTAWKSGREKGATGRPVPLLMNFLLARAARTGQ